MENQIHQEFQRLKIELDKLSSYSRSIERAEENVKETSELIEKVGEKYENLVDLIWREFNEELDSLKDLKSQIQSESKRIEQALNKLQQEGLSSNSRPESQASTELLKRLGDRVKALETRTQGQFDTLGTHMNRFAQLHQTLESNLSRKIDYQLGQLNNRITQLDIQIQDRLKESLSESLAHIHNSPEPQTGNPINNGLGKHLKDQLESIQQQMTHSDVQLKDLIQGSLEESLSNWLKEHESKINADENTLPENDSQLSEQFNQFKEKLEETDLSIRNIVRGLNVNIENVIKDNQQQISESTTKLIKSDLQTQFQQVENKLSQSGANVKELLENLQESFHSVMEDNESKSKLFQELAKSLKKDNNGESLETIKKVTRNQFQKLLDHENDMKKQKQLLGIVTVISLLNLALIVIMIITFYKMSI